MTARSDGLPPDELRALIRDVLRDVLPAVIERGPVRVPAATATSVQLPAAPPPSVPSGVLQPAIGPQPANAPQAATAGAPGGGNGHGTMHTSGGRSDLTRPVRLETDADLHQFALEIVRLADNPARRRDLLTGRLTFTLAARADDAPATGEHRIDRGAVTERAVQSAAKAGQRLVLGPRAVLTPLARDRALSLGVPIERER
jgi:hypothetical protein